MTRAEEIVTAAARAFGIRAPDLSNTRSHSKSLVATRQAAAWIMRTHASMSYPEIARAIGYSDHTSAMDAHRQACRKIHKDAYFARCLHAAESEFVVAKV